MGISRVFIVNVWRAGHASAPEFRASVRAVEDEEPLLFTTAAELARHFALAVAIPVEAASAHAVAPGSSSEHRRTES